LIMVGEVGRAVITRIEGRIEDWKAGRFSQPANSQHFPDIGRPVFISRDAKLEAHDKRGTGAGR
ncbi:MAG TPA: hypothetical protein VHT52_03970, partial [Stellaceae bacterium]|nr:hypothetical protein [Stellaceae bacterium]